MSNRERWILYPLLVLALGASLRTQLAPEFKRLSATDFFSGTIHCNTLEVGQSILLRGENGKARLVISDASGRSGQIQILGENGKSLLAFGANRDNGSGAIELFNANGEIQVRLASIKDGGVVAIYGADQKPLVGVEHDGNGSGQVVRYDVQGHRYGMLGFRLPEPPPAAEEIEPAATGDSSSADPEASSEAAPAGTPSVPGEEPAPVEENASTDPSEE